MNELKILFQSYARYNQTMNAQVYAACAALPDEARRRDLGAWFQSIHGTLNHILLADKVWLGRFTNQPFHAPSLDTTLFETWDEMLHERASVDQQLIAWIDAVDAARLRENLDYQPTLRPDPMSQPLWLVVAHLWNHQAHHRGQATALMNALGADSGVTDLIALAPVTAFVDAHPL